MASPTTTLQRGSWHSELNRGHWRILGASFLGWIFDGYETYALFVIMAPALHQLLAPSQMSSLSHYAGIAVAATLLGWAFGGVLGGIVADYWGRKRTMMLTIIIYASFTAFTGLAQSWTQLVLFRFLTGLGLGGEWATGATLVAESWPLRARAKGLGMMQCAFGWGSLLAAGIWYFLEPAGGPSAWRYLFFIGVIPAFFVLFIRRRVEESERWMEKNTERKRLQASSTSGAALSHEQRKLTDFTVAVIFRDPNLRKRVLLCMSMSVATTIGYWGISSWIPAYVESIAKGASVAAPARWGAIAGLAYNFGAIAGYLVGGFFADVIGRKKLIAFFFAGSLITTPAVYLWTHSPKAVVIAVAFNGAFTLGQFVWMAIYPPELFPTAVRATAVSLIFNSARFISFLGPLFAGVLIGRLGGFSSTAMILSVAYLITALSLFWLPETTGQPLPE